MRSLRGLAGSLLLHTVAFAVIVFGSRYRPAAAIGDQLRTNLPKGIVWLAEPGPGGGGGGGGNGMKLPPRRAELPGKDNITVPVAKPRPALYVPPQVMKPVDVAMDVPQLDIPAKALAAGAAPIVGTLDGVTGSPSQGPGSGGGAGSGRGTGVGPGDGPGMGPGRDGGTGGGPRRPGTAGLKGPFLVRDAKPIYTAEAMRAKIQGVAIVECVVQPNGTVASPRIVKSIDPTFGLDQEAIKTAMQFRFLPATVNGEPVPILVNIEIAFNIR